ncbi:hypothetical protein ACVNF4_00165 [Streptomyces sp. S6]
MKIKIAACLAGALAGALLLTACSGSDANDTRVSGGRTSQWDKKAGAPEAASFMHVSVPDGATQVKGAVQLNPQEDVYILSFVTSRDTAKTLAKDLRSEEPLSTKGPFSSMPDDLFEHLGLADPEKAGGVGWVGVCPPCVNDHRRAKVQWIEMFVEPLKSNRSRVYLQAF